MDPALAPMVVSKDMGPSNIKASITPALKAHRKLPPSKIKVSYSVRLRIFEKIRQKQDSKKVRLQVPFGTRKALFL